MEKIIRVTGEGEKGVKPDTIEVALNLNGLNKDYSKSLSLVDEKVIALKDALKSIGIKDVKTQNFSVRQKVKRIYTRDNNYKDEFEGFETNHNLKVSFDYDTKKLGEVVNSISATIVEPRLNISFVAKNVEGVKVELLKDAVEKAKVDAQVLADAAGVKLGSIVTINHSFSEVRYDYPQNSEFMAKACRYGSSVGSSLDSIEVENIKLSANVTIEWEIK